MSIPSIILYILLSYPSSVFVSIWINKDIPTDIINMVKKFGYEFNNEKETLDNLTSKNEKKMIIPIGNIIYSLNNYFSKNKAYNKMINELYNQGQIKIKQNNINNKRIDNKVISNNSSIKEQINYLKQQKNNILYPEVNESKRRSR